MVGGWVLVCVGVTLMMAKVKVPGEGERRNNGEEKDGGGRGGGIEGGGGCSAGERESQD